MGLASAVFILYIFSSAFLLLIVSVLMSFAVAYTLHATMSRIVISSLEIIIYAKWNRVLRALAFLCQYGRYHNGQLTLFRLCGRYFSFDNSIHCDAHTRTMELYIQQAVHRIIVQMDRRPFNRAPMRTTMKR